jgi:hypothetical protein
MRVIPACGVSGASGPAYEDHRMVVSQREKRGVSKQTERKRNTPDLASAGKMGIRLESVKSIRNSSAFDIYM